MSEERARVLQLLRDGKITVEEAEKLLDALGAAAEGSGDASAGSGRPRILGVRVTDLRSGKVKTNVRLPAGAGAFGLLTRLTRTQLGRKMKGIAFADLQRAARTGKRGNLVDVTNEDRGERIEVFFE